MRLEQDGHGLQRPRLDGDVVVQQQHGPCPGREGPAGAGVTPGGVSAVFGQPHDAHARAGGTRCAFVKVARPVLHEHHRSRPAPRGGDGAQAGKRIGEAAPVHDNDAERTWHPA